jgi:hypothetical protein
MACNECGGYREGLVLSPRRVGPAQVALSIQPASPPGFSISPRRPRMASKGLRVAAEGSSIGPWERAAQTDQDRTNGV